MTKLRHVALSKAARRLLQNIEQVSKKESGTQEVRRQMRFDTNALRIRYGVPIFVTFTPDEAHNRIMLRLSRARNNDPVFIHGRDAVGAATAARTEPSLLGDANDVFFGLPVADALCSVPAYDERRKIIARDSLASVDGFKMGFEMAWKF